jgi:CDP-diacylglycerol--glycerol-3-phosphate 3-phosphatidyltransferase
MFEAFQRLLMADETTTRFAIVYIGCLLLIYFANIVYALAVGERSPRAASSLPRGTSQMQSRGKRAAFGFANAIAALNVAPNQITLIGLFLVGFNCLLFVYHNNPCLFGTSLIAAYLFDTLDGVVARAQGSSSKFGGYLDAVIDRYQEIMTYCAIGFVTERWLVSFLIISGSMLTSYNKARAAIEIPVDNKAWPDFLSKPTRLFFLCVALIGDTSLPWLLPFTLWSLAILTHFTALQRMFRAYFLIQDSVASELRMAKD